MNTGDTWPGHFEARREFERLAGRFRWGEIPRPATPARSLDAELAKLREAGLHHLAGLVQSSCRAEADPTPDGFLFDPGPVSVSVSGSRILGLTGDEAMAYVAVHASGDCGLHGGKWHDLEISDEHKPSVAIRNQVTLISGAGLIRSRFPVYRPTVDGPGAASAPRDTARRRNQGEWIEIVSLIGPGASKTLVYTSVCGG